MSQKFESFYKKVQEGKFSHFDDLPENKFKPIDKLRSNNKLVFCSQNPIADRQEDQIFEVDNKEFDSVSNRVMKAFLTQIGIERKDVYFTNLIKSTVELDSVTPEELQNYKNLFYEELEIVKPWVLIFISSWSANQIDRSRIRCPIVELKHPSYYFRQCGNEEKAADMMYKDLINATMFSVENESRYNTKIDFANKIISFRDPENLKNFFKHVNNLKIINIDVDSNWRNVMCCVSDKQNFHIEFNYLNYCWIECATEDAEKYTLKNKPVRKFFYRTQKELPFDANLYEKDIRADYRFIIDYYDYFEPAKPEDLNYLTFDLETNKSVDVINVPGEIISIVYLLNDKYEFLVLENPKVLETLKGDNIKIFKSEAEMLYYFANVFVQANLITGFNLSGFDLPYLLHRAKKLGINPERFSPLLRIKDNVIEEKDRMDETNLKIFGLDIIDTMLFAKDKFFVYSLDKPSQMNLDYLGNFLHLGQKIHDARGPYTLWCEEPTRLYEYNIQDVKLCRDIENYMGMAKYLLSFKELMSTFNIKWSLYNSKIIDFFILCNYTKKYAFPSKGSNVKEDLVGAYVKEPISGIYDNVAVIDFSSMYPSIIRNFNISYETISSDKNEFVNPICIDNKFYFTRDRKGLLGEIVDKMIFMKTDIQKKIKTSATEKEAKEWQIRLNAIKALINGLYGVFGYRFFRLYDIRAANAITAAGRYLITHIEKYIDASKKFLSLASDTDSLFVWLKEKKDYKEAIKIFEDYENEVNAEVSNIMKRDYNLDNTFMRMECETVFKKLLMTQSKKKYYGFGNFIKGKMYDTDKEYGRGTELVKKDTPNVLRPVLKEMLLSIVKRECDLDIKKAVMKAKTAIFAMSYKDLLITKQISREIEEYKTVPQHVRAMQFSNKVLGTQFSRANYKGGLIFVTSKQYPHQEVIMLENDMELPKEFSCNYKKYFDLFVKNKLILFAPEFEKFFKDDRSIWEFVK